jgi:hypothetical protein
MKGARGWLIVGVVSVLVAAAVYIGQPRQDSPEHSSDSDASNGASAALLFAQAMGHPTNQIKGTFSLPTASELVFVFTPTSSYTSDEASRLVLWVRSGGVLVYASEQGDDELDHAFGVRRINSLASAGVEASNPTFEGVNQVTGASWVMPVYPAREQVPFLRTQGGSVIGYVQRIGSGTVVLLADPLVICNGSLEKRDNGRLLSDLLGLVGPVQSVSFDEYHHGVTFSDFSPQAWVTTPWGAALLWFLVAIFFGLVLRGRRFGPVIERPEEHVRTDAEWAAAVGRLLRRSSARAVTIGLLATATERAVATRTGLPLQPRERFWNALWVRAPGLAAELAEVENTLQRASASEADLLIGAQRLHRLAHPISEERRRSVAGESTTKETR